jgi:hypothetical protein
MKKSNTQRALWLAFTAAAALVSVWTAFNCTSEVSSLDSGVADGGKLCNTNADCKVTETCRNHACVPAGICSKQADCKEGEDCVSGRCVQVADGGTDAGETPDGSSGCQDKQDCDPGYDCNPLTHGCEAVAIISVDPADLLNFGAVSYGEEKTLPVTITNKGKLPLQISGYEITNPAGNNCFSITAGGDLVKIEPDKFHVVQITYKQNGSFADEGKLRIASNDKDKGIYSLTLKSSYKGLPKFAIVDPTTQDKLYPLPGDGYQYYVDLGYVAQGTLKHMVVGIKNITDGDAILSLDDFTAQNTPKNTFSVVFRDGADPVTSTPLPTPVQANPLSHLFLAQGALVYMHVDYDAKNKADSDGQDYKLATNDDDINASGNKGNNVITMKLVARTMSSKIEVIPTDLDFKTVQKGDSAKKTVTISNKGDSDLNILATSGIKNTSSGTFYSTNPSTLDRTIHGHSDFAIEVVFSPTALTTENNYLVIDSDDADTPHIEIPLKGTGIDPTLFVSTTPAIQGVPPVLDFGSVARGSKVTGLVTVSNTGFGDLLLNDIALTQGVIEYYKITNMKLNGNDATLPVTLKEQGADTLSYNIEFTSDSIGTITASMKFDNSDMKHKDYTIYLAALVQNNLGENCQNGDQCSTGFCVDGVCCNNACDQACQRCDDISHKGFCMGVTSGPDPNGVCQTSSPTTCGQTGNCKGSGLCELWAEKTICASAKCTDSILNLAHECDGEGTCLDAGDQNCSPFGCSGGQCKNQCNSVLDCATGFSCNTTLHVCLKNDGQQCGGDTECYNNKCCSGYCRNLQADDNNCGTCGTVCQQIHAVNHCVSGACNPTCTSGFASCDSNKNNGCEYDLSTYVNSSGTAENLGSRPGEEHCATALFCLVDASRVEFANTSGHQSKWYRARVTDTSGCDTNNSHRVTFNVPSGVTYDIKFYSPLGALMQSGSVSGASQSFTISKYKVEFDYWIEITFKSGTTCSSWTLKDEYNSCLE